MRKIKGYGEIYLPLGDDWYNEAMYDISDFDIELIGWDDGDGGRYNRYPVFRLTRKKDEDEEVEPWEDDAISETAAED